MCLFIAGCWTRWPWRVPFKSNDSMVLHRCICLQSSDRTHCRRWPGIEVCRDAATPLSHGQVKAVQLWSGSSRGWGGWGCKQSTGSGGIRQTEKCAGAWSSKSSSWPQKKAGNCWTWSPQLLLQAWRFVWLLHPYFLPKWKASIPLT